MKDSDIANLAKVLRETISAKAYKILNDETSKGERPPRAFYSKVDSLLKWLADVEFHHSEFEPLQPACLHPDTHALELSIEDCKMIIAYEKEKAKGERIRNQMLTKPKLE